MLNFVCVKAGSRYSAEYVNILFDMVRRNLAEGTPGRFVCFTDDPNGLDASIEVRTFPGFLSGWWPKLYLFQEDLFPKGDRIIYFDLDAVIVGALDELAQYQGSFAILRDPFEPNGWNSSVMAWEVGEHRHVWYNFVAAGMPEVEGGDQVWIQQQIGAAVMLQDLHPGKFLSFKADCFSAPPRGAWVVYFHGEPKPENCGAEWVRLVWKIGGGTAAELEISCNVADEKLRDNIRSACKMNVPWLAQLSPHDGHAVIVGGSPSTVKHLDELRWRKSLGQKVFATNNAFRWLISQGIQPDAHVILDARESNADFVVQGSGAEYYLASQCHPDVFDRAGEDNITLWHAYTETLDAALENPEGKPQCLIACGSTVGLSAMGLAYALGYRLIHVYGMDSSYSEGEHHAYAQPGNDNDAVLDVVCGGKSFKAAPWMVAQADQFQVLATELANGGCTITVRGQGLIPWLAHQMQFAHVPDTETVIIDKVMWPSRDQVARPSVLESLRSIPSLLRFVPGRDVAVQAGGNVGLWPLHLSLHFDRVVTFEPDALNWQCMQHNLKGSHVEAHNKALSNVVEAKGLARDPQNCGAHFIVDGAEFETMTIDSLELDACDLIQLDIEGYELNALKGAEQTILKYHPVICLELKGLGKKYGITDTDVTEWLAARGYREGLRFGRDVVFITESKDASTCTQMESAVI